MRIVSLVPSVTETLVSWGVVPVACTRFCEQPDLAHVGGTKNPDLDAIRALQPDLVVMEREENRREDYEALIESAIDVLALSVRSVADVASAMSALAARVGLAPPAPVPALGPDPGSGPGTESGPETGPRPSPMVRVFVPIWRRPYMALGCPTYASSLLALLGAVNVLTDDDGPYPTVTLQEVRGRHPDVVLAPSEPYPFGARHRRELETVAPCLFVDGQDLFWWGARTAGALERLAPLIAAWPR